jgi:hypothetical protein
MASFRVSRRQVGELALPRVARRLLDCETLTTARSRKRRCPVRLGSRQLEQLHRFETARLASPGVSRLDEVLVLDAWAGLTPADMVERKINNDPVRS